MLGRCKQYELREDGTCASDKADNCECLKEDCDEYMFTEDVEIFDIESFVDALEKSEQWSKEHIWDEEQRGYIKK